MESGFPKNIPEVLLETANVLTNRTLSLSTKFVSLQLSYFCNQAFRLGDQYPDEVTSRHQIDLLRAHIRQIAEIISYENRALVSELSEISENARFSFDNDGSAPYQRRWRAKP